MAPEPYNHQKVEPKWQDEWLKSAAFAAPEIPNQAKAYVLDMFPYPSGDGLHVGHPEGYTASDIFSRYLRMTGKDVLHPMGWDAFGLPAENYAIKTGTHPSVTTKANIATFKRQIQSLGFSYDWSREVNTTDPGYYKWTQWIFLKLFEKGLAYEAEAPINWCPKDKTGLANEEVVGGKCDRCGTVVEKKNIRQWLVKITDAKYIERLLNDLDQLDWPESIKQSQRNWIGKSEGAEVNFSVIASSAAAERACPPNFVDEGRRGNPAAYDKSKIASSPSARPSGEGLARDPRNDIITVFTTRPDTLFGATYMVLAPEHELVLQITTDKQRKAVEKYQKQASHKSDIDRTDVSKAKTGVFTGAYAINPVNREKIPIWIADYVLSSYGTGAIMAVPAHDERDYAFAKKYKLPIVEVIKKPAGFSGQCYSGAGDVLHSGDYNGMRSEDFQKVIVEKLAQEGAAKFATNYKLRDWVFSRQRYWGEPIPIVHCEKCKQDVFEHAHELHFYDQASWQKIIDGKKTIETRALNPEEKDRYFGNIGVGAYLKLMNMRTKDVAYYRVTDVHQYKQLRDFLKDAENFKRMAPDKMYTDVAELEAAYSFTLDYVERIEKNGLIAWGIAPVQPGIVGVPEAQLPVTLPKVEKYEPTGTGESPLAGIKDWVNTKCPTCGGPAKRETNTMPQWAGSDWYFLRYCDPRNDKQLADPVKLKAWLPVDTYIGGAEHAVLHLLYSRFIYKFLFDIGAVPKEVGDEPFTKLINQGLILAEDGQKMSKSRGNVINPDLIVREYGADSLRMFEMFMGSLQDAKPWSTRGIVGVRRFLEKVWKASDWVGGETQVNTPIQHIFGLSITKGIKNFQLNTCVSDFMKWSNNWKPPRVGREEFEAFLKLLSPFAPHLAQELWFKLGHRDQVHEQPWPVFDPALAQVENVEVVVQINGKVRDKFTVSSRITEEELKAKALGSKKIQQWLGGKQPKKIIVVKGKLVSVVI